MLWWIAFEDKSAKCHARSEYSVSRHYQDVYANEENDDIATDSSYRHPPRPPGRIFDKHKTAEEFGIDIAEFGIDNEEFGIDR